MSFPRLPDWVIIIFAIPCPDIYTDVDFDAKWRLKIEVIRRLFNEFLLFEIGWVFGE